jgi:hypothetical protein
MRHGLSDADPDTERVHLELLRSASSERRLRLAFSLSRTTLSLSKGSLIRSLPGASPLEIDLRFAALLYGTDLAKDVRADLAARRRDTA